MRQKEQAQGIEESVSGAVGSDHRHQVRAVLVAGKIDLIGSTRDRAAPQRKCPARIAPVDRLLLLSTFNFVRWSRHPCKLKLVSSLLTGASEICCDNALAETINGLYEAAVIHRRGPWRSFEAVERDAGMGRLLQSLLLEPIGNIPPAEAEQRYYAMLKQPAMAA